MNVGDNKNSALSPQSSPQIEHEVHNRPSLGQNLLQESLTHRLPGTDAVQEKPLEELVVDFAVHCWTSVS